MAWTDAIITELMRGADPSALKEQLANLDTEALKDLYVAGALLQKQLEQVEEEGEEEPGEYDRPGSMDKAMKSTMGHGKKLKGMGEMILLLQANKKKQPLMEEE